MTRHKLSIGKPAPIGRTEATATSAAANPARRPLREPAPLIWLQPSFKNSCSDDVEICSAGASPNSIAEIAAAPSRKAKTLQSASKLAGRAPLVGQLFSIARAHG